METIKDFKSWNKTTIEEAINSVPEHTRIYSYSPAENLELLSSPELYFIEMNFAKNFSFSPRHIAERVSTKGSIYIWMDKFPYFGIIKYLKMSLYLLKN